MSDPNNPEGSETETETEVEEPEDKVDVRLQKSVDILIKQTKIDPKKMEGLSLEDQFDRLSFLMDNLPKPTKSKNKPVVPVPTNANDPTIGRKVKDGNNEFWLFKPSEWLSKPTQK